MNRLSKLCGHLIAIRHGFYRVPASVSAGAKARSTGDRLRTFLRSKYEGQSLVEFAMALPITMMVFTGIFAVAIAISNDVALNVAVEAGARYMATEGKATGTNMATLADPCQSIFSQMVASSTTLNPANITVTYTLNGSTIGPYTGTAANTCSSQSTAFSEGGNLTLVATYPCTIGMYGFNFSGCQITAAASQFIYTS